MPQKQTVILVISILFVSLVFFNSFRETQLQPQQNTTETIPQVNVESIKTSLSFQEWKHKYSKIYQTQAQTIYRMSIFLKNKVNVHNHNRLFQEGKTLYRKELNRLADLSKEQFQALYNWKSNNNIQRIEGFGVSNSCDGAIMDTPNPPSELDWTQSKKVTDPTDQGTCGKDWAMVSIGAVQSLYAIKIGQLPNLSVQQMLQCSGNYGNEGCYGGFMDQAFWYMIDSGVATVKSYPDREVSACRYVQNMKYTGFSKCARVPSGNYSKLVSAVVQQPVSVALDFSQDMASYSTGIFDGKCTNKLTHGMLLTGYGGKQHGTHYWILRNTLGTTWGLKGYIHLLKQDKDGQGKCGVMRWPSVPQTLN